MYGSLSASSPTSWSQIIEQTPGYGLTSSTGEVTHLSTSMGGMPGYVAPPPGLTLPDYSIWSMPPQEASLPEGLPGSPWYRPPIGRASQMRATLDRQAQALLAPWSQAPGSQAPALQIPQMAPPLCQPLPSSGSQPVSPYQQAVQPPSKTMGLGVTFNSSADKHAAAGGQDATTCGRPATRGRDGKSRPTSLTMGAREKSSVRMTSKQMLCQVGEPPCDAPQARHL